MSIKSVALVLISLFAFGITSFCAGTRCQPAQERGECAVRFGVLIKRLSSRLDAMEKRLSAIETCEKNMYVQIKNLPPEGLDRAMLLDERILRAKNRQILERVYGQPRGSNE